MFSRDKEKNREGKNLEETWGEKSKRVDYREKNTKGREGKEQIISAIKRWI